ncbi:DUF4012 domain-containing protein [Patescibacteria group bacterium]|nr:DUF4012 domain-containing protein [Patescibacteria group bacterium]
MGALKHYYLKRKSRSSAVNSEAFKHDPEVIMPPLFPAVDTIWPKSDVLNMDFRVVPPQSKLLTGLLRWGLLIVLSVLLYFTGAALRANNQNLKDSILLKGETATNNLQNAASSLIEFDLANAQKNFRLAERNFNATLKSFALLGQGNLLLAGLPFNYSELEQGQILMSSGRHLATAGIKMTQALEPLATYGDSIKGGDKELADISADIVKIIQDSSKLIDGVVKETSIANNLLADISIAGLSANHAEKITDAKTKAAAFYQLAEMIDVMSDRLPAAIGFNNPKYYLILNQNPNEARPTGGFLGSYVLVKLYKGKVEKFYVDDIHRIDGQNRNNDMELPTPLRAVTTYYGMRDANWEPNFATSVKTIQKLYEQAGGGTVDGMLAVNPEVVSDILTVVGNLSMPEYGLELTPNNLAMSVQKNIEVDNRGAYSPKQLLIDAAPVLINKLISSNQEELSLIGQKLIKRLTVKDILVYFSDPELERIANLLNWGGEIKKAGSSEDYLMISEANLGGNKSSASLSREVLHRATIASDGAVNDALKITFRHQGSSKFPDGTNKNYMRVYLPNGSRVEHISGYDEGTQIVTDTAFGKTVIGFWLTTEPGASSSVSLEYTLPFKLDIDKAGTDYKLIVQKQPGVYKNTVKHTVETGRDLTLDMNTESVSSKDVFAGTLLKDETLLTKVYKR